MSAKKSIQNKQLTHDEILSILSEMEVFRKSITEKRRRLTNLERRLPLTKKNSQEMMVLRREVDQLEHDIHRQTKIRFDIFLRLIVRVRNLGSLNGTYTKSNFMSEVKHYLDITT